MKLQPLNLGLERAERLRLESNQSLALKSDINDLAHKLEKALLPIVAKAQQIKKNVDYSHSGRSKKLNELKKDAELAIKMISPLDTIKRQIELADTMIINTTVQAKERFTPNGNEEKLIDILQQQELRRWLFQSREEAKKSHEKRLKSNRSLLTDEERAFVDPVAEAYLTACQTFDTDKGSNSLLIRAVELAPFPVNVLDRETLDKGAILFQQQVAKDHFQAKAAALAKHDMALELILQATDIANNPTRYKPFEGIQMSNPDNQN